MDMQDDTTQKKLRVGGHDFIVAVGSGVTYREYSCYKILLANGSDYFDNMFGNHCLESANNRVYFKDIDPSEWELLYGFIVPDKDPTNRPVLDRDNFSTLLPLFHLFQMEPYINQCNAIISEIISGCNSDDRCVSERDISVAFWGTSSDADSNEQRKNYFDLIIVSYQLASKYNLPSLPSIANAVSGLLSHLEYTGDLFDTSSVCCVVESMGPLYANDNNQQHIDNGGEEGEEDDDVEDDPTNRCRRILGDMIPDAYRTLDDNGMVCPLLVHASINKKAMYEKMVKMRQSAYSIISHSITTLPRELFCLMPHLLPEDHFHIQSSARTILQQLYRDSTVLHDREYDMLNFDTERLLGRTSLEELARDAVFHYIKSSNNAQASLRDAIDCASEVLASNGVESAEERQILVADAMNWLHTNEYIMMSRESGVCCREKYLDSIE